MYEAALESLERPKRIKRELPVPYVLEQTGAQLVPVGSQLLALCPFHPDRNPSLYMHEGPAGWRWGCWSCGTHGDVLDLIQAFRPEYGFSETLDAGDVLIFRMRESGWLPPVLEERRGFDAKWAGLIVRESGKCITGVDEFLQRKELPLSGEYLQARWGVGSFSGELIVPVWDLRGELVGVKHRRLDGSDHLFAYPGSQLMDVLYGELRAPRNHLPVILCEGESDAWVAEAHAGVAFDVLALAAGAGQPPKPAERLAGREVHICFDGDAAGRLGAQRWAEELQRVGARVQVWDLPDGADLASLGGPKWLL